MNAEDRVEIIDGEPAVRVTRKEYDKVTPRQQGYVWYMQEAWNPNIPNKCPYPLDSREAGQWQKGADSAYWDTLDGDDE